MALRNQGQSSVSLLSVVELIDLLQSPFAIEKFSSLTGAPMVAVDLTREGGLPSRDEIDFASQRLLELACPTIALGGDDLPESAARLTDAFDVRVEDDASLMNLRNTVATSPIASLAMVQLLRHTRESSVHNGLIAESLAYSVLQSGPEFDVWLKGRTPRAAAAPNNEPAVLMLRDGEKLNLTLNRPDRRNAFSAEMRDALVEALQVVISDSSIREVVIRGAGPAFSAGGDLAEFGTLPDPATAHVIRSTRNPARLLGQCANRVRCEVQGACVGAGMELPAFTRHVRAREDAFFWLPEIAMGLVPGAGGTVSVPRRIGRQRTNYLALSGRRIDARTALAWGLVDEIAD